MLRELRSPVLALCTMVVAACGGGDAATGGNAPAPKLASLTVTVSNLPPDVTPNVLMEGPNGFARILQATTTVTNLTPGSYTLTASNAETESAIYAPMPAAQNVELQAGKSRSAEVTFGVATASLQVAISGLPAGTPAAVTLTGPNDFTRQLTATATFTKLQPGAYSATAAELTAGGDGYATTPATSSLQLAAGASPVTLGLNYAIVTGRLQVTTNGLPPGANPTFQVSGPNEYTRTAAAGETLLGLVPGTYTISSPNVTFNGNTYAPTATSVTVAVSPSAVPVQTSVVYALSGTTGINLTIENLYITQAVQTLSGSIPLIAGRDGLLRVFVRASGSNNLQPQVRVRLYSGTSLVQTLTLEAPASAVPTTVDDATLASAWYGLVPGSRIQPGLHIVADVDPTGSVAELLEGDNTWPASGSPASLTVRSVPLLSIRFVPIRQSNDLTGNVSVGNTDAFLNDIRRMFPIGAIDADVRATYTSSAGIVQANDGNGAWSAVLTELNALRTVDGNSRSYYGVLKTGYSSGVAGLGYLGSPVAIGWDRLPSGADVMAHELGHNWNRWHSPCGGAGSPDPKYPYSGGRIGVAGYDLTTSAFKPPTTPDLMGYCVPDWVSDFTYMGIMNYRDTYPLVADASRSRTPEPGMLVWGRITDQQIVLEPAFNVVAPPSLPPATGAHRIEGLADDGTPLFSYAFDGTPVDHSADRHFAFVIPQVMLRGRVPSTLRLRARGRVAELRSSAASVQALSDQQGASPRVRRITPTAAQITWSDAAVRGVLVRDARTGEVLSLARGGVANVETSASDIELVVSDGVRSRTRRVTFR